MRGRAVATAVLLAATVAAPAGAHDGDHPAASGYPPLPAATPKGAHAARGATADARTVERRVRRIEQSALGRDHAIEHAEARAVVARVRTGSAAHAYDLGAGKFTRKLQPTNDLPPAVGGFWEPSQPLPIVAINAVQLHTGKVLYFSYPWRATEPDPATGQAGTLQDWDSADAYIYDPRTGQSQQVTPPVNEDTGQPVELFCAGQSLLTDGRVLITGGNVGSPAGDANLGNHGLNTTYVFDPDAFERGQDPWTEGPRMNQGRWYPTQTLLPDGRTTIMSGQANGEPQTHNPTGVDGASINRDIEVYVPDEQGGTLERLTDRLDGAGGRPPEPGQYPRQTLMPSGDLLTWGPFQTDTWSMVPPKVGDKTTTYADVPAMASHREWSGGVPLPGSVRGGSSKVLLIGGSPRNDKQGPANAPTLATTTYYDETRPGDGWQAGPTLNVSRAFANTVLLPDGKVAVVGGGRGDQSTTRYYRWTFDPEQRRVELLDPADLSPSAKPVLGNAQAEGRTYHSTALLLPDGRVWSAGDDINGSMAIPPDDPATPQNEGPDQNGGQQFVKSQLLGGGSGVRTDSAEIWSPPYLFEADGSPAARPSVVTAPGAVPYGGRFGVRTRGDAAKAVLVAAGATTHAVDMSQRMVTLDAPERVPGRGINLEAPTSREIAPPGWYMLFVLDADGTPSTAAWVRIDPSATAAATLSASDAPTDPDAPPAPTGTDPPVTPPPPPPGTVKETKRLKVGVRLSLASTLSRLRKAKRFSAVVTVDRAAAVTVAAGQEVRRSVKVKGKRKRVTRTVALPLATTRSVQLRKAGARRVTFRLSATAMRRLRASRTATLRVVVTAKPRTGKAVRVTRRPVLR